MATPPFPEYDKDLSRLDAVRRTLRTNVQFFFSDSQSHTLLLRAYKMGVPITRLFEIAGESTSWTKFTNRIHRAMEENR